MFEGIDVVLFEKTKTGENSLGEPTYEETPVTVRNVLIMPATATEIQDNVRIYGKIAVYTLAIPKGDKHEWKDSRIEFFDKTFHSFGEPVKTIDHLTPGPWNMKVTVEYHE